MTVVGVVEDVRHFGLDGEVRREMFRPYSQLAWPQMTVDGEERYRADGARLASPLGAARDRPGAAGDAHPDDGVGDRGIDRHPPVPDVAARRVLVVALLLAAIGVYGVVSYVSRSGRVRSESAWPSAHGPSKW